MLANAQRDGRPAEHRWRPLFNAAKFGWRPLIKCRAANAAKTRNPLKYDGVPQTRQSIIAVTGPKFIILWGHVEEILLLNNVFFRLSIRALMRRYSPTKLYDGAQMANFGDFVGPAFSASRVSHVSDLHSKFALRPHHVSKYGKHPMCGRWD